MGQYKKLWYLLFAVLAVCFTILGYMGSEVYKKAPPYPERVVSASGTQLMTKDDILAGQSAWQTTGGMEVGSVLGHGAYQAPDWTADWLHRELVAWLDLTAQETYGKKFNEVSPEEQAVLKPALPTNTATKAVLKKTAASLSAIPVSKPLRASCLTTTAYTATIPPFRRPANTSQ